MKPLAERIREIPWFHTFDFGDGIITPGAKSAEVLAAESVAFFDGVEVKNATVLDIGAWNGFYSFEAKRRGARRVVAADHFAWQVHTARGLDGLKMAQEALNLDVETISIDVPNISEQSVGRFDIVLFLGVFYHLPDPLDGLRRAASVCDKTLIVETYVDLLDLNRPAMAYYPTTELVGDPTNWWGPNPACMISLMETHGFSVRWKMMSNLPTHKNRAVFHGQRQ